MNHPAACTIVARNYLPHARALAESYRRHHPGARFYLLVVDQLPTGVEPGPGITLIKPEQLELPYLFEMCFKYDVTELSTAVKPTLLALLLDEYGEDEVLYFDPDILIARPLTELKSLLDESSIVLIPHLLKPIPLDGKRPNETDILIAGAYNLGFIGLRKSRATAEFLRWWEQRLRDHCMVDPSRGLMTDQKWIDLIPGLFPQAKILRDPTCNVAYWNIHSRPITRRGKRFFADGKPLAFYHFSGFDPRQPRALSKHQDRTEVVDGSALADLLDVYVDLLMQHGYETARAWEYGYSRFETGIRVNSILRQMYLKLDKQTQQRFGDPFKTAHSNSFLSWATTPTTDGQLSPFLERVYRMRFDLISTFPDINGQHREPFLRWVLETGTREMGFEEELAVMGGLPITATVQSSPGGVQGINVCGYLRNESGLGAAARGYIRAIKHLGLNVAMKDVSHSSLNRSEDSTISEDHDQHPWPVNLICINPEQHFQAMPHIGDGFVKDRYNIGVWAWELPRFPEKWQDRFQYFDEIWVGSSFVADALAPASPIPVVTIPPVLTSIARGSREEGRRLIAAEKRDFVFLFTFDFHSYFERKNPLAVINAFKLAFNRARGVKLIIKCVNDDFKPEHLQSMRQQAKGYPISILTGYYSDRQMRDLSEAADCYVSLHRTEGTGLTLADAMALGKPVIATGWSGNTDFMNGFNSFPVRYQLVKLKDNIGPYRAGETWAEPSVEHAAELMRFVRTHPREAKARGAAAKAEIETRYSEAAIAELIRHRLKVIAAHREFAETRQAIQTGEWEPKHVEYERTVQRVRDLISSSVPAGAKVLVVSKGDDRLLQIDDRHATHFPQNGDGVYAGYHPTDSAMAIDHLEDRRKHGAQFFVLPNTAFWWLDHYVDLKNHLDNHYRVAVHDEACIIFDLAGRKSTVADPPVDIVTPAKLEQLTASLEAQLEDVRESLFAHSQRAADDAAQLESRMAMMREAIDANTAAITARAIDKAAEQSRINELATLIESHESRLAELGRATHMRISELATSVALLRSRLLTQVPDSADGFGRASLFKSLEHLSDAAPSAED
jgi:glycosyltransferase involved in cell wall biosynthesis